MHHLLMSCMQVAARPTASTSIAGGQRDQPVATSAHKRASTQEVSPKPRKPRAVKITEAPPKLSGATSPSEAHDDQGRPALLMVGFALQEVRLLRASVRQIFQSSEEEEEGWPPAVMGVGRSASRMTVKRLFSRAVSLAVAAASTLNAAEAEVGDGKRDLHASSSSVASDMKNGDRSDGQHSESDLDLDPLEARGGLADGRLVLLCGEGLKRYGATLNETLLNLGE